jgi:hypothetical protein
LAFADTIRCIAKARYLLERKNNLQFRIKGVEKLEKKMNQGK